MINYINNESITRLSTRIDAVYAKSFQYTGEAIRMAALTPTTALEAKVFDIITVVRKGVVLLQDELVLIIKVAIAVSTAVDTKDVMTFECMQVLDSVLSQMNRAYE